MGAQFMKLFLAIDFILVFCEIEFFCVSQAVFDL